MGIIRSERQRNPYVPLLGANGSPPTLLGGSNPNVLRIADNDPLVAVDDTQVAQASTNAAPARGVAPNVEPPPGSPPFEDGMTKAVGHVVALPNGARVQDPTSDTGYMMSPVPDLRAVAAAGRRVRIQYGSQMADRDMTAYALMNKMVAIGLNFGQGGVYDYQRGPGNSITGFEQLPHFRNVSNFNVGLFSQQAGLRLDEALAAAGLYSRVFGRTDPRQPDSLMERTADFIRKGYAAGQSGVFDEPIPP
jgi:hypothetical protein